MRRGGAPLGSRVPRRLSSDESGLQIFLKFISIKTFIPHATIAVGGDSRAGWDCVVGASGWSTAVGIAEARSSIGNTTARNIDAQDNLARIISDLQFGFCLINSYYLRVNAN